MVVYTCYPSTGEMEAELSLQAWGQSDLQREAQASQRSTERLCLKITTIVIILIKQNNPAN